jgi:hypothetical protein
LLKPGSSIGGTVHRRQTTLRLLVIGTGDPKQEGPKLRLVQFTQEVEFAALCLGVCEVTQSGVTF